MNLISDLFLLERLDYLIRTKATGTPRELASRLKASERNVYRLIGKLREEGFPIAYDKCAESYYYDAEVYMRFDIIVGQESLLTIQNRNF